MKQEMFEQGRTGSRELLTGDNIDLKSDLNGKEIVAVACQEFPPDLRTARQDRAGLVDPKYQHRFLWQWRSVCVLREEGRWLRNKREIAAWVHQYYPGLLANEKALLEALDGAIMSAEDRARRGL